MKLKLKKVIKPLIHILTWVMLIVFSYIVTDDSKNAATHMWLPLLEAAIIFYVNYLFLIDKFIFPKRQYALFIAVNILLILFFRLDMYALQFFTGHDSHNHIDKGIGHKGSHQSEPLSLLKSLLGLVMPTIFALLTKATELWGKFELEKKEVANMQLQSELKSLKYQLQPHFFFNSLNNIYSLVDVSPSTAQEAIHNLSKLMQYLLHETNNEQVDLSVELNFLKKYIRLMEIRQNEDITTNYNFPDIQSNQYSIAPLLLIPIIENAYKHGVSATHKSEIAFEISITNNQLVFHASNTNFPKTESDISGSGIGLENLRKRLELIYPDKHKLTTKIKDNKFNLSLTIDLNKTTDTE